ncbi:MAG TPA: GNAT family N-acetyltransferase [Methylomirabilota bacterium]|nr:GNAT family N-acetyltransferase [Methylomirabilota bacterium]
MSGRSIDVRPVTADRWEDLATLFGPSGAFSNCWCTWWRQTATEFSHGIEDHGAANRTLMHEIVEAGSEPGLLAIRDSRPVGWISVAPRPQYGRILRSRRIGPQPDEAEDDRVWSIVCFWIPRAERGKGVANELLKGAIDHAKERGARHLEAYPVDTAGGRHPAANLFTGTLAMFQRAGFHEVDRPRGSQLVMRRDL